jgi:hypothetical protein
MNNLSKGLAGLVLGTSALMPKSTNAEVFNIKYNESNHSIIKKNDASSEVSNPLPYALLGAAISGIISYFYLIKPHNKSLTKNE